MTDLITVDDIKKDIIKTKEEINILNMRLEELNLKAQELCSHERLLVTTIIRKDGGESFKNVCSTCGKIKGTPSHEDIMKYISSLSFS